MAEVYRAWNGAGDVPQYSMLFRTCELLESLFGKINLSEKNISNLEGLEMFLLGKAGQSGVGERLRYLSDHHRDKRSSFLIELSHRSQFMESMQKGTGHIAVVKETLFFKLSIK